MIKKILYLCRKLLHSYAQFQESVRLAAERAAESVRRLIIRLSTSSNEAKSQAFLSQMLPVILNCATQSPIKVNKAFGLVHSPFLYF